MTTKVILRPGLIDRAKQMSGLRTDSAFARAIGVSEATLSKLRHGAEPTPRILAGLFEAFGLTPGEAATVTQAADTEQLAA